jgi:hypothetical protein
MPVERDLTTRISLCCSMVGEGGRDPRKREASGVVTSSDFMCIEALANSIGFTQSFSVERNWSNTFSLNLILGTKAYLSCFPRGPRDTGPRNYF